MTINNLYFGELRYDKKYNWLDASILRENIKIDVHISLDDTENSETAVDEAEKVCRNLDFFIISAEGFAVDELLNLKNESWLEEGEEELVRETFIKRMKLKSIIFSELVEFWFYDGDLFWGHMIRVSLEKNGKLFSAGIED